MKYEETLTLYRGMMRDLEQIPRAENNEMEFLENAVALIRRRISELEEYIAANAVSGPAEQVLYFKAVYPMFCAELFYYAERYNIEKALLVTDAAEWADELNNELKRISGYYRKNKFLVEYYRLGLTELDAVLFTTAGETKSRLLPEQPSVNFEPAMAASQTFAQIMGNEKLKTFIQEKISSLGGPPVQAVVSGDRQRKLKWTGEAINMVEMAYGIWLTGQVNSGNATITDIMAALETLFDIRLGRPYRRWTEISGRKLYSHTKFIDQMKEAIDKRIDGELSLN